MLIKFEKTIMEFSICCIKKQTILPRPVDLDNYEVAVTDCYVSPTTIADGTSFPIKIVSVKGDIIKSEERKLVLDVLDVSPFTIVRKVTELLDEYVEINVSNRGIITVVPQTGISIGFSKGLSRVLGLKYGPISIKTEGTHPVSSGLMLNRIMITSDIVEPILVDDTYLACCYFGPTVSQPTPQYYRALPYFASCIDLDFRNGVFENLKIPDGSFSIMLKFRKKSS